MIEKTIRLDFIIQRFPLIGILCFSVLFIYSSTLYPGGSQASLNSEGFDWINNYWCNLMNEKGMNGEVNPARPFSILAMTILCMSLMVFFIQFADIYTNNELWKRIIKICGIVSMLFASLIFTQYHDLMTVISSIFGLFAVVGIIRAIYKSNLSKYKIGGALCIVLLGVNNYIYYTEHFITALPLLQKITFAIVLTWIAGLNFEMTKKKPPNRRLF